MQDRFRRALIIGNSGCGKSTLASRIADLVRAPTIDLDLLHWEDGGYGSKRDENVVRGLVAESDAEPKWVIEGVHGWFAEVAVLRTTALLWLDLPWSVRRTGLLNRGLRRGSTSRHYAALVEWAEAYWSRRTTSSFASHLAMFETFPSTKLRLCNHTEVDAFISSYGAWGRPSP